jgi:hypothetical protein
MIGKTEQVTVGEAEEGDRYYAYVSFHSARAASQARAATSAGEVLVRSLDTHFEDSHPDPSVWLIRFLIIKIGSTVDKLELKNKFRHRLPIFLLRSPGKTVKLCEKHSALKREHTFLLPHLQFWFPIPSRSSTFLSKLLDPFLHHKDSLTFSQ